MVGYLSQQSYHWEVIIIDDGSTDNTARIEEGFSTKYPSVSLLRNPHRGKGYTVKTGMLAARGEYRFLCDADLSMPIDEVAKFLPPAQQNFDVAIGSREVAGARRFNEPALRHLMGRVFNFLVRLLAVRGFQDTQCGFKCFRGEGVPTLFSRQRRDGFGFDVEVLFIAQKLGLRIVEVPIDWYYERESKVRPLRDTWNMLFDILSVRWNHWRGRYE